VTFITVLWNIEGSLTFTFAGRDVTIPGFLVVALFPRMSQAGARALFVGLLSQRRKITALAARYSLPACYARTAHLLHLRISVLRRLLGLSDIRRPHLELSVIQGVGYGARLSFRAEQLTHRLLWVGRFYHQPVRQIDRRNREIEFQRLCDRGPYPRYWVCARPRTFCLSYLQRGTKQACRRFSPQPGAVSSACR
jgi:hypothetical protein